MGSKTSKMNLFQNEIVKINAFRFYSKIKFLSLYMLILSIVHFFIISNLNIIWIENKIDQSYFEFFIMHKFNFDYLI